MTTTVIANGNIIDGSGKPAFKGHLVIVGDRIDTVLPVTETPPEAEVTLDANGKTVTPGFIDMHSHVDWLLPHSDHEALLGCLPEQGVTTVVGGNCGFSPAPVTEASISILSQNPSALLVDRPLDYTWRSMDDFFKTLDDSAPIVNVALLVGHATTRALTSRLHDRVLSERAVDNMIDATERSLAEGACGISLGLGYEPGMYAPLDELEAVFRTAAHAGKTVTVHLKALSRLSPTYPLTYIKPHNIRALREMIDLADKTAARLQLSHFIFVGRRSWGLVEEALALVEQARQRGVDVMIDAFPFTCGNTTINVVFPYWFMQQLPGGYRRRSSRARLRLELEVGFRLVGFLYKDFQVMDACREEWQHLNGRTIAEIAADWGTSPFQTLLTLSEGTGGNALMLFHTYSGENGYEAPMDAVLSHASCLFESDAVIKSRGYPNPAALGTFPKILGPCARDKKMFRLEEAVRRMTSASAERFGLPDRGLLTAGKAADVVVFDPKTVSDTTPGGSQPAQRPTGIEDVFINGIRVVENGCYKPGHRAGRTVKT